MKYIQSYEADVSGALHKHFIAHEKKWNKLMGSIVFNDINYFNKHYKDYNLEDIDNEGNTVLLLASRYSRLEILKTLIDIGVNIHHKNDKGEDFYDIACNKIKPFLDMKFTFKQRKIKNWIEKNFPEFITAKKYNL